MGMDSFMDREVTHLLVRAILSRADSQDKEAMKRFLEAKRPGAGLDNFERRVNRSINRCIDDAEAIIDNPAHYVGKSISS